MQNNKKKKEEPIRDEEKETLCLFDFKEEKCGATFITKDKILKIPSSFLSYMSDAFKDELENNSNVVTDRSYTADIVSTAFSYYRLQFHKELNNEIRGTISIFSRYYFNIIYNISRSRKKELSYNLLHCVS